MQRVLLAVAALLALALTPSAAGAAELLPDLVPDRPTQPTLAVDDSAYDRPALLLRFNGFVRNAGPGALDVHATRPNSSSPMTVRQRIAQDGGGWLPEFSPAELIYTDADGHNHWHLQRIAAYSLWRGDRSALAQPSEKVGFCLMDSQHMDLSRGPSRPVYVDDPRTGNDFCMQRRPEALTVFEGISAGWRDIYDASLAFQWVDASEVQPGSYWLRSDVDPENVVREADEVNAPAYATASITIPGYLARPVSATTAFETPVAIDPVVEPYGSAAFGFPTAPARLALVTPPAHGELEVSGTTVTYRPDDGFSGIDTFTYLARDPGSPFPRHPATATATVRVGAPPPTPTVAISGAPQTMIAGASAALEATVTDDAPTVTWTADAGTITPGGTDDHEALYVAPATVPADGTVTITASTAGASTTTTIAIVPKPDPRPAPLPPDPPDPPGPPGPPGPTPPDETPPGPTPPGTDPPPGEPPARVPPKVKPRLSTIRAIRTGRLLIATTRPTVAGRVRVTAYLGARRLGACTARVPAGRLFSCRVKLARAVAPRARIRLVAGLRSGRALVRRTRASAPVPWMRMRTSSAAGNWVDWGDGRRRLLCALPRG